MISCSTISTTITFRFAAVSSFASCVPTRVNGCLRVRTFVISFYLKFPKILRGGGRKKPLCPLKIETVKFMLRNVSPKLNAKSATVPSRWPGLASGTRCRPCHGLFNDIRLRASLKNVHLCEVAVLTATLLRSRCAV